MAQVHVIFHTHWDREWYFTEDDSQVLLNRDFKQLFATMSAKPEMTAYLLDGQASILEEYLQLNPDELDHVKHLVASGRLITGPWYTQSDLFNVSGESLIRNLIYGIRASRQLGGSMMIGYVPDAFGQNAQMPTLLNTVGIKRAVGRRGYDAKYMGASEFNWQGLDGHSSVLAAIQPYGYSFADPRSGARMGNLDRDYLMQHVMPILKELDMLAGADQLMLPIGGDQTAFDPEQAKLVSVLNELAPEGLHFVQSSLGEYFDSIQDKITNSYQGELRMPRLSRVHKAIGSARYDIKHLNAQAEITLTRQAEVIEALCYRLGLAYDQPNLTRAWKMLLNSQPHDSMGTCNSDETNNDIKNRLQKAKHTAESLFNQEAKIIAANVPQRGDSHFIVVNGSLLTDAGASRHRVVTRTPIFSVTDANGQDVEFTLISQTQHIGELVSELSVDGEHCEPQTPPMDYLSVIELAPNTAIPALGYTTFYIHEGPAITERLQPEDKAEIVDSHYRIGLNAGELVLEDMQRHVTYHNWLSFEDQADDGDLYDFSPLAGDLPIDQVEWNWIKTETSASVQTMTLNFKMSLPKQIDAQRQKREGVTVLQGTLKITLSQGIKLQLQLKNPALDHRLRLKLAFGAQAGSAIADLPFGYMRRTDDLSLLDNWQNYYAECPINIEPFEHSLMVPAQDQQALVISNGLKEYQLQLDGVAITLFRSVGAIGKPDLLWRPGRASGREVKAPQAQLVGEELDFELTIHLFDGDLAQATTLVEKALNPWASYQFQSIRGDLQPLDYFDITVPEHPLPATATLLAEIPIGLRFSAITIEKNGLMVRLANTTATSIPINDPSFMAKYQQCNALAEPLEEQISEVPANGLINLMIL